jgi:hypothetical protein
VLQSQKGRVQMPPTLAGSSVAQQRAGGPSPRLYPGSAARIAARTPRSNGPSRAFVPCGSSGSHRFGGTGTGRRTNTPVVPPSGVVISAAQPAAVISLDFS